MTPCQRDRFESIHELCGYFVLLSRWMTDTGVNIYFFAADLALMSYECEAPETQFEKERRKSLRWVLPLS